MFLIIVRMTNVSDFMFKFHQDMQIYSFMAWLLIVYSFFLDISIMDF